MVHIWLSMTPDYVVVGHCALDRQPDGSLLPGGTVLYAALTAARLGMRAAILTAGEPDALHAALAPYRDAFDLVILPTPDTTTFENVPAPTGRRQTLHGWAGPISPDALPDTWRGAAVLHLGPIADELPPLAWAGVLDRAAWPAATPQGWLRRWGPLPSPVRHVPLALPDALLDRLRVLVISNEEEDVAGAAMRRVAAHGLGVVTQGAGGAMLYAGETAVEVPAFRTTIADETGAGDVFAAALYVGLAHGQTVVEAARFACAAASLSIRGPGPTAIPTVAAVHALIGK